MTINNQHHAYESIFRPVRLWLLCKSITLSTIAAGFVVLTIYLGQRWWLSGTVLCLFIGFLLICHYNSQRVIIRDKSIVYRHGILALREQVIPLWRVNIATRQTVLGRVMNYGAVSLYVDDKTIVIPQVGMLKQFRNTLIEQQNALVEQTSGVWLAPHYNNHHRGP